MPILHKSNVLEILLIISVLLVLKVLYSPVETPFSLFILRLSIPSSLFLFVLIFSLNSVFHLKIFRIVRISSKNSFLALIICICTFCACLFDQFAGIQPLLLIPGMMALGFIYWNQMIILFVSCFATFAGTAGMLYFLNGSLSAENTTILILSFLLTELEADVIRRNLLPGEERMRSLEEENKELWNLSYRDSLTGLFNRRYMQQTVEHVFSRAVRYREQLHVLMIDIDHFKKVNDTYGHAVGDEVLKIVASTIQTFVRTSDIVARYGGEEFIVYIVESDMELTQFIANRIRDGIASIQFEQVPWTITISIGITGLQDGDTIESQISRADQFLYSSKKNGRNRVTGV